MGATGKIGKRTKKFQKKHLDGELRRRKVAKIKKQRATVDARRRARNARDSEGTLGCFGGVFTRVGGCVDEPGTTRGGRGCVAREEAALSERRLREAKTKRERKADGVSLVISKWIVD